MAMVLALCFAIGVAWYLARPGAFDAAFGTRLAPLRSERVAHLTSDGSPIVLPGGRYAIGFSFVVDTMNFNFYGSDETCVVRPFATVTATQGPLKNVRVNGRYDASLFATFALRASAQVSCDDRAGRRLCLTVVELP